MPRNWLTPFAALSAALAIAAGAFAAHGASAAQANLLRVGAQYQLIHAIAVFAMAARPRGHGPSIMLLSGANVFALSLYALACGAPRWVGIITPFGGVLMILGWLWVGVEEVRHRA
ncbi:MAG: DUF423 domain-containing protein [Alphaproteobacteria bacterium]|nr:DUF423 domain-containing protein [Alphaproteobacteria bacterium]MDE2341397.1 DUF423 domain-containing protein [Alphaproteobacteria bacterium]